MTVKDLASGQLRANAMWASWTNVAIYTDECMTFVLVKDFIKASMPYERPAGPEEVGQRIEYFCNLATICLNGIVLIINVG